MFLRVFPLDSTVSPTPLGGLRPDLARTGHGVRAEAQQTERLRWFDLTWAGSGVARCCACRKKRVGVHHEQWQNVGMSDYERIARVIRYLNEHHTEQPDLATLAASVGLSQFHFHRLFSRWVGATPKDFLQCLTLEHVKALLRERESVLEAALDAGLSGPGRLHDLCVNLEAASPGEVKNGGAGLKITFGFADSPFGRCLIGESQRGICHLSFVERDAVNSLRSDWPNAVFKRNDKQAAVLAARIFARTDGSALRAFVNGTEFQLRVWRALLQVPAGQLVTYGHVAAAIGRPAAARSVGGALGQNPLAFLIPCHRVIRETGAVGGYRWGPLRKRAMIAWESAPRLAQDRQQAA